MKIILEQFLQEKSIFGMVAKYQSLTNQCSERCRKSIRNGKNYQSQVSVCTSKCKINNLQNLLKSLQALRGTGVSDQILISKILYIQTRLAKEMKKIVSYRNGLKKRQITIPVSMSLKSSPERWNSREMN